MAEWAMLGAGFGSFGVGLATASMVLARSGSGTTPSMGAPRSGTPTRFRSWAAVAAAVAAVVGWLSASPTIGIVGPLLVATWFVEHRRRLVRAGQDRLLGQLPVVVDTMIQRLRSGSSLHQVCLEPPTSGEESEAALRPMVDALRRRRPLAEAVTTLTDSPAQPLAVVLMATALLVLALRGGPAVPALQRLRLTLMGFVHARAEAQSQAAQARASAAMLAVAPGLFAAIIAILDRDAARFYLAEPPGTACVLLSAAATYIGWRWMERSIARVSTVGSGSKAVPVPGTGS